MSICGDSAIVEFLGTDFAYLSDATAVTTEYGLLTSGGLLGATTQVTDQASKKRQSVTDSLGDLARVIEDPASSALATDYSYS